MDKEITINSMKNDNPLDREKKTTEILSLRDLLCGYHYFRVPDYQRGYAWNDEFRVLWKDIKRLVKAGNQKHYTGMLSLEEIKSEAHLENEGVFGTSSFYIVDGQQRITTFIIIINSLLTYIRNEMPTGDYSAYDELLEKDHIYRFGYSAMRRDGASDYFERRIYRNDTSVITANKYLSNINEAKLFFDNEMLKMSVEEAIHYLDVILDRMVFNLYFVTNDFDVRVTFETINNRGKKLSNLELLKNRLMYLSTYFPKSMGLTLKNAINNAWKIIYVNLCLNDVQLDDDEYLKAHWIVYKGLNKRSSDQYIHEILDGSFSVDKGDFYNLLLSSKAKDKYDKAYDHINKYIESLSAFSSYWAFVKYPDLSSITVEKNEMLWIQRLSRISSNLYLQAALMVIVAEKNLTTADKIRYYEKVELFFFVNKLLAQERNDLSFLSTSAKALLGTSNKSKLELLNAAIAEIEKHPLHVDKLRVLAAFRSFKTNVLDKKERMFYDWGGIRYFLYEYDESIKMDIATSIKWYELNNTSVEHVLPQTIKTDYWKTAFKSYTPKEILTITNSLGNLLLLSSGAENSSLSYYSYPVKRSIAVSTKKFSYSDGSRSAREIAENPHWTINEIVDRNENLITFMMGRWFKDFTFSQSEKESIRTILLNGIPSKISNDLHTKLTEELDAIDTSKERIDGDKSKASCPSNYLVDQFKAFIPDDVKVYFNPKNIQHKDWFTCVLITNDDKPKMLYCGVIDNSVSYDISYSYDYNEISVCNNSVSPHSFIPSLESTPEKIKPFILSLFRYLKHTQGVEQPTWKQYQVYYFI